MLPRDGDRPAGVVTPEAVRLEFETAGVGSRAVAWALDQLVQFGTILLVVLAVGLLGGESGGLGIPVWLGWTLGVLFLFAALWGYPIAMETLWRGRTLGKAAMGLRVVTVEGSPVRFRHAAVRAILGLVDFQLTGGLAAVLSALLSKRNQRLGDLVAGTIVLRERTGARAPVAVRFAVPAGAESYAATLDPAGMSAQHYAAVRSFLLRAPQLPAQVRADLAARLATPLAAKLHHVPPATMPAESFLLCLAARYQQRGGGGRPGGSGPALAVRGQAADGGEASGEASPETSGEGTVKGGAEVRATATDEAPGRAAGQGAADEPQGEAKAGAQGGGGSVPPGGTGFRPPS